MKTIRLLSSILWPWALPALFLVIVCVLCRNEPLPYPFSIGVALICVAYFLNLKNIFEKAKVVAQHVVYLPLLYVAVLAMAWAQMAGFAMLASPPYIHIDEGRLISCNADAMVQGVLEMALYFSAITLTTVGYGDCFPVSADGRIGAGMAAFLGSVHNVAFIALMLTRGVTFGTGKDN